MSGFIETFRGVVYPWHCDHQGHMNTMHYVGMFDQAFWHHMSALGFTREYMERNRGGSSMSETPSSTSPNKGWALSS